MGSSDESAALGVVRSTSVPIHDIGTAIYLSPDVFGWAAEWGWSNPFSFYFAGRGGMLGDVGADVVTSTFGWFEPNAVQAMYTEGVGVAPASEAAARMAEAHSKWGRKHYARRGGPGGHRRRHRGAGGRARGLRHPGLRGVARRRPLRDAGRPGRPADADPPGMARRPPPGRHHCGRAVPARGDPHERGAGAGEVLRLARALPRRHCHQERSTTRPRRRPTGCVPRRWPRRWTPESSPPSRPGSWPFVPPPRSPRRTAGPGVGRTGDRLQ